MGSSLSVSLEVKNQARVHLWYEQKFGKPCPRLQSTTDGIDRYLISCTCVGIKVSSGALYAPHGLDELWEGLLRINPMNSNQELFHQKAQSYKNRWPWLAIV